MPIYECKLCNISTHLLGNYNRHLKTLKHIRNGGTPLQNMVMNTNEHEINTNEHEMNTNEHEMNTNDKIYQCDFCDNAFNTIPSKRRHEIHYCKENPDFMDKMIKIKNKKIKSLEKDKKTLEKEKKELYNKVSMLLDKVGDTNIQNNIILNNYGKEDMSHITDAIKTALLKIPYGAIPKLIEQVHFNDKKPENKNIMLPNKKDNLVKVFQGDKWVYKDKNETITNLVDSKYMIMDDHFEDTKDTNELPRYINSQFIKFKKYYDEDDKDMVENLKKDCELVLLNNR